MRSGVWHYLWKASVASIFRFQRFLFSGVTTVIPDSHCACVACLVSADAGGGNVVVLGCVLQGGTAREDVASSWVLCGCRKSTLGHDSGRAKNIYASSVSHEGCKMTLLLLSNADDRTELIGILDMRKYVNDTNT